MVGERGSSFRGKDSVASGLLRELRCSLSLNLDPNLTIALDELGLEPLTAVAFACPPVPTSASTTRATTSSPSLPPQSRIELQYLHDYAGISTSVRLTANPVVNFAAVLGSNVLSLGTSVSFDSKTSNFTKCNASISFSNADLIASLAMNNKGDSLTTSYYHIVNLVTKIAIGGEVTHSFSSNVNTITVGTQHMLDALTMLKARINNFGKASALIQHEWRPGSFFTVSGEVDTKSIDKSAMVGLALALKP
ncbi:hypothetical protein NL676_008125 [Syzygium grande]|nr:hypothetical protein NL676_008125 [Syzygium grande]